MNTTSPSSGTFRTRQISVKTPIPLEEAWASRVVGPRTSGSFVTRQVSRPEEIELQNSSLRLVMTMTLPPNTTPDCARLVMEKMEQLIGAFSELDELTLGRPNFYVDRTQSGCEGHTVRLTIRTRDAMMESDWTDLAQRFPKARGLTIELFANHEHNPIWQTAA